MSAPSRDGVGLWQRLVHEFMANGRPGAAHEAFFAPGVERVGLVRDALRQSGGDRAAALALLPRMSLAERQALFADLVQAARSAHGPIGAVRELIIALPRPWVLERLVPEVEAILRGEEYDDYWMMLELCAPLDADLARRIARRAAAHSDPDTRELGEEWIERLAPAPGPAA